MLLNEVQRQDKQLRDQDRQLAAQQLLAEMGARLERLESSGGSKPK